MEEGPVASRHDVAGERADQMAGVAPPPCFGGGADGADLGPSRRSQAFSGHRHQGAVDADPEVGAEFVGARPEGSRFGPCDEVEHVGDAVRAQFDQVGAGLGTGTVRVAAAGPDHLTALQVEDGLPTRRWSSRTVEHVGEGTRAQQLCQIGPVGSVRLCGHGGEGCHVREVGGGPAEAAGQMRVPTAERPAHRVVENRSSSLVILMFLSW